MSFFTKIFGDDSSRTVKRYQGLVERVNKLESDMNALSDDALRAKTVEFRERLAAGETLDAIQAEAFAAVREAAQRTLKQRHFDVQLIGGAILHSGSIAEMKTGEGKTLVATLPAYLNALEAKGVHVVTVNDYLARRDAVWMGQIFHALGLTVGVLNNDGSYRYDPAHTELDATRDQAGAYKVVHEFLRPVTRHEAYAADITYGTNSEFGFDYLRDNLEYNPTAVRQREYHYAIVDEIDSILIDEARTPLIISGATNEAESLYAQFNKIAQQFQQGDDYTVDEKFRAVNITDNGITKAERALGIENLYTDKGIKYVHHLETALRAKALYKNEVDYVVRDGQIIIVDTFTGRLQPGRRWSEGLHQAIEAKEGVKVQQESRTYASITYQNYFRMYKKLSGMTGTAATSAEEFMKVYLLPVISVPTHRPVIRKDLNDLIFRSEAGKFKAIARTVKELSQKGQPVLIGTVSIEKNQLLAEYLKREGVQFNILNAKNHEQEGQIIAEAGKKGAVTVATNMAGRGVDIKLGGPQASQEQADEIRALGGLYVIGTERHEARRIDNQLRGRSGRQGDPGMTQFYVSTEDDLMRIFAADTIKKMMGRFNIPEDQPIENYFITRSLESAQTKIEGFHFDSRKHTLEYDDVLNHQRAIVYGRRRALLFAKGEELDTAITEALALGNLTEDEQKIVAEKRAEFGDELFRAVMRRILLQTIDLFWVDHLETMDYLRGSVNLRAYGQRDPLVEYKKEGLRMFKDMQQSIVAQAVEVVQKVTREAVMGSPQPENQSPMPNLIATQEGNTPKTRLQTGVAHTTPATNGPGRNEKVTITKDGQQKEIKFKQLEKFQKEGWMLVK
jgi:preprotein translocase subunit SecA